MFVIFRQFFERGHAPGIAASGKIGEHGQRGVLAAQAGARSCNVFTS